MEPSVRKCTSYRGMVSCSDYDDDINSLNDRVAAVEEL